MWALNKSDRENIEKVLRAKGLDFDTVWAKNPNYIKERCRRMLRPPPILHRNMKAVYETCWNMKDEDGKPLFNEEAWRVALENLELFASEHFSDEPDLSLYTLRGYDQDRLALYVCLRGKNICESFHQKLTLRLSGNQASAETIVHSLAVLVNRHNARARIRYRPG